MGFFSSAEVEDRPSIKLGRLHEAQVEIHRHGGDRTGSYWYQGQVRVLEAQVRTTEQVSMELHDPVNAPTLVRIRRGLTDEQVVEEEFAIRKRAHPDWSATKPEADAALSRVTRLRYLAQHAKDNHVVRFYSLDRAGKSEERILAFVDQDPVTEAPQKRYTETEKGWRQKQIWTLVGMGLLDALFLFGMLSFANSPVTTGVQTAQVQQQATTDLLYLGWGASLVTAVLLSFALWARRTLVSSWEIEPIRQLGLDTHSEAVYLQNSQEAPASDYLARVLGYDAETISDYALAVANLPVDAMSTMQEQSESQRNELDTVKMKGIETAAMTASLRSLGMRRSTPIIESGTSLWIVIGIVGVLVAVGVIAVILAMGG